MNSNNKYFDHTNQSINRSIDQTFGKPWHIQSINQPDKHPLRINTKKLLLPTYRKFRVSISIDSRTSLFSKMMSTILSYKWSAIQRLSGSTEIKIPLSTSFPTLFTADPLARVVMYESPAESTENSRISISKFCNSTKIKSVLAQAGRKGAMEWTAWASRVVANTFSPSLVKPKMSSWSLRAKARLRSECLRKFPQAQALAAPGGSDEAT